MKVLSVGSAWSMTCRCSDCKSGLEVFQTDIREENLGGKIRYQFAREVCGAYNQVPGEDIPEKTKSIIMRRS